MTYQEAIEQLQIEMRITTSQKRNEVFKMAIAALEKQETDKWIPISPEYALPEPGQLVLVEWERLDRSTNTIHTYYNVLYLDNDEEWTLPDGYNTINGTAVAWRELPGPYRRGQNEKDKDRVDGRNVESGIRMFPRLPVLLR